MVGQEACWVCTREMKAEFYVVTNVVLRLPDYSNPQLDFVAAPALRPAEVEIDAAQQAIYEKELEAAAAAPLPDEVRSITNPLLKSHN